MSIEQCRTMLRRRQLELRLSGVDNMDIADIMEVVERYLLMTGKGTQ